MSPTLPPGMPPPESDPWPQLRMLTADLSQLFHEQKVSSAALATTEEEALYLLTIVAELKGLPTGIHMARVGFFAESLARECGWTSDEARHLRLAAPLQDIGMLAIPEKVLQSTEAPTDAERRAIAWHPDVGAQILSHLHRPLFAMASQVALTHHERHDGQGYPRRLAGDAIPKAGQIAGLAGMVDALMSDRPYRPALSTAAAMDQIRRERGGSFSPALVDAFESQTQLWPWISARVEERRLGYRDLMEPGGPVWAHHDE